MIDNSKYTELTERWETEFGKKVYKNVLQAFEKIISQEEEELRNKLGSEFNASDINKYFADLRGIKLNATKIEGAQFDFPRFDYSLLNNCTFFCHFFVPEFSNATLRKCNMKALYITQPIFQCAQLLNCTFDQVNSMGPNFENCTLENCHIRSCDISNVIGSHINFSGSTFKESILSFSRRGHYYQTPRIAADDVSFLNFNNCVFENTELDLIGMWRNILFNNTTLLNLSLTIGTPDLPTLENISFINAKLTDINFTNLFLSSANFTNANLDNVNFSNTNLQNAIFTGASLKNVNFEGANLEGAVFD